MTRRRKPQPLTRPPSLFSPQVALIASMLGKSVAVAEPRGCLLAAPTGWVSKALRQCGRDLGAADGAVPVPWAEAERYLAKTAGRALNLTANKFRDAAAFAGCDGEFREPEVLAGPARFLSPSSALVGDSESDAGGVEVEYRNAFICVGSTSLRLPFLPWAEGEAVSWLYDGDTIKDIGRVPSHLVIQGGGTISTEYAFIFRSLGSEVTLCMREENLMEGCEMDRSIQEALLERMLRLGIRVFAADGDFGDVNPPAEKGGTGTVTLRGSGTVLKCDAMMSATGRVGMCDGLDLEAAGCLAPVRGCVPVDPQTMMCIGGSSSRNGGPASGIYAAGDCEEGSVVTPQGLLSTGLAEAYIAASAAFPDEMEAEVGLLNEFDAHCPVAVWVEPTVAYVGRSAEAAERDFGAAGAGSVAVFFKETIKGCVERKKAFEPDEFLKLVSEICGRSGGGRRLTNAAPLPGLPRAQRADRRRAHLRPRRQRDGAPCVGARERSQDRLRAAADRAAGRDRPGVRQAGLHPRSDRH